MPKTTTISMPIKGMLTDLHQFATDSNAYGFALNAMVSDRSSGNEWFLQNEMSNICSVKFPAGYRVVGFREVPEQKRTIYALVNSVTGGSQIGEVINCGYTNITDKIEKVFCRNCPEYKGTEQTPLQDITEECYCDYLIKTTASCLNFDVNYPVDIEYKITDCGLNIYFTDFKNERRYLYFDYMDDDDTQPLIINDDFLVCSGNEECICPDGFEYDAEQDLCVKTIITPLPAVVDPRLACAATNNVYGTFGVALYSAFNLDGTGTYATMFGADTFWSNPSSNSIDGRLNFSGLWPCNADGSPQGSPMLPLNENVGFIFGINVPVTKTYYIGIAGDNKVRIRIDCVTVMDMDPDALDVQYGGTGNAFKYWQIYPVSLTAGRHVIELTGRNFGSVAGFGAEVYDNTEAEIIASAGGADLNTIFSTHNKRGTILQVSTTFSAECPGGACMEVDDETGDLFCVETETTDADCNECRELVCTDVLDCEKLKFHPNVDHPCVEFIDYVNGGNLPEGMYQVLIAYADAFGNPMSTYYASSHPAPLFGEFVKFETNNLTNKGLAFKITNLKTDSIYKYYNIVIAKTVENFTEFLHVGTFSTTQSSYVYTGFEKVPKRLAPTEIFFDRPFYPYAKGVTSANNYLFFTGVKEYPTLNLQPVANAIRLQWQTVALKEKAYYDPRNTFYFKSEMRDEVVPYGVVFEFTNGRETCVFHIPGRVATETDLEVVETDIITDLDCNSTPVNKRWQVYNTGSVVDGDYEYNENCDIKKCWEYGDFAYWESTETYPHIREIWGELCGQPIRHHKYPDCCVSHIHDGFEGSKIYVDNNYIFPIGVKIDHSSVALALNQAVVDGIITQEQRDSIKSYRIVRGNRVGNKSIDAKGLIFNMWKYSKFDNEYYYPNYPYNDLNDDYFLAPDDSTYDGSTTSNPTPSEYADENDRFTFHSPDVHFVNTALGNILKLETEEYGKSEGYFTHSECQAQHQFPSTAARAIALGFGVAAALSATGEKTCKVVEYKSDQHVVDFPVPHLMTTLTPFTHISVPPPVPDTTPVGGVFVPSILTVPGGAPAVSLDTGFYQTWYNNKFNTKISTQYEKNTGAIIPAIGPDPLTDPKLPQIASEHFTSCRGETYQLINSNLIVNAILGFGGAGLGIIIQKVILGIIEAGKVLDTIKVLLPYKNYSTQYNSVGKYNNYKCVPVGNKNHKLLKTAYLEPIIQNIDEPSDDPSDTFETIKINNWHRESSVYLKTEDVVDVPTVEDNSRVTMNQAGLDFDELEKNIYRDISSYYVSIKRYIPNQYGQLCNIEYLETNSCSFVVDDVYTACEATVFGGDTFINRFALKRKMPFFIHTMCGLPKGADVKYSELGNVAYPNYYFNTEEPFFQRMENLSISIADIGATLQAIVGTNATRLDAKTAKFFYQNGYAHMFSYGVPYFFVESDINVDFRHAQNKTDKDFYPHNSDLKTWFEEENVPISTDNTYLYNRTYSKQNKENDLCVSCILNTKDLTCQDFHENRLIYSEPSETEKNNDNWLIFKANNYWDFPQKLGKLITADGIESGKVLVRLTKGTQMFPAFNTIQATEDTIQVGTGGLFQTHPIELVLSDLGYAGTQHKDILHTEFGHIWGHAEHGQIFNLANGGQAIDEISKDGMRAWFKENLPFQIKKDFNDIALEDIDNNLKGIGLHYCFDKRFNRFLITKLDYKKVNNAVLYDKVEKIFYILEAGNQVPVSLTDAIYFCNKSWTISYNVAQKSWTSFHSYTPNFYVENIDTFDSGISTQELNAQHQLESVQKLYTHNATNKSFQVFYGNLEPFVIELQTKPTIDANYINSVNYTADVIRYHNEFDTFYNRTKTFNKAIVYTNQQTSGLLNLAVSNPDDMTQSDTYPKVSYSGIDMLVTNSQNVWNFNDFWDVAASQTNNVPLFNYDCNNVNKQLNIKALNYGKGDFDRAGIRSNICKVRLINDKESLYKFIVTIGQINQRQNIR